MNITIKEIDSEDEEHLSAIVEKKVFVAECSICNREVEVDSEVGAVEDEKRFLKYLSDEEGFVEYTTDDEHGWGHKSCVADMIDNM